MESSGSIYKLCVNSFKIKKILLLPSRSPPPTPNPLKHTSFKASLRVHEAFPTDGAGCCSFRPHPVPYPSLVVAELSFVCPLWSPQSLKFLYCPLHTTWRQTMAGRMCVFTVGSVWSEFISATGWPLVSESVKWVVATDEVSEDSTGKSMINQTPS